MSLVNDVLRQLDSTSAKPHQGMPLQSLMVDAPSKGNKFFSVFFIALIALLLATLSLQLFYKQSLIDVFNVTKKPSEDISDDNLSLVMIKDSNELLPIPTEDIVIAKSLANEDLELETVLSLEPVMIKNFSVSGEVGDVRGIINNHILNTNTPEIEASNAATKYAESIKVNANKKSNESNNLNKSIYIKEKKISAASVNKDSIKKETYYSTKINAVENLGFKQYQLALKAYKKKQSSIALSWIDLALDAEKKEEYLRLKVRILMQKGSGDAIHRFILEQSGNKSLTWFELIAPSLQMYSYYELSNKYYSELVKQQPNEVKWQLAMALNFSKLGLDKKTYAIYENLLKSSLLTYKQQRWIATRLERMQQVGVIINER